MEPKIAPGTVHAPGRAVARERGEPATLKHSGERRYDLTVRVLDGRQAIAEAERWIRAVGGRPDADYPEPSGACAELR